MENQNKKSLKWLWIAIAIVVVAGIGVWCGINASKSEDGVNSVFSIASLLFGLFLVTVLGYMLGRITIKGVSLGDAGVFLVAILFGFLFTKINPNTPILGAFAVQSGDMMNFMYSKVVQNIGLVLLSIRAFHLLYFIPDTKSLGLNVG